MTIHRDSCQVAALLRRLRELSERKFLSESERNELAELAERISTRLEKRTGFWFPMPRWTHVQLPRPFTAYLSKWVREYESARYAALLARTCKGGKTRWKAKRKLSLQG